MPTYPYGCTECKHEFDVIKPFSEFENVEVCPKCSSPKTERYIGRTHFYGASDWDNVQYNPGLGVVTRNAKHAARVAKERGLIEVGSESCDNIMSENEKKRTKEIDERFEEAFAPVQHHLMNP